MQDYFYRNGKRRLDTQKLYITNAVKNPGDKPEGDDFEWSYKLQTKVDRLRADFLRAKPAVILTFGAFAFEFLRRACGESPTKFRYWGTRELGKEFKMRICKYDNSQVNVLPLLHVSISRGKFLESHKYFVGKDTGNYFKFAGTELAKLFLKNLATQPIWIE